MKCTLRGEPCVAKMLKAQTNATAHDDLIRELDLFCSIHDHPNIIKFLGKFRVSHIICEEDP